MLTAAAKYSRKIPTLAFIGFKEAKEKPKKSSKDFRTNYIIVLEYFSAFWLEAGYVNQNHALGIIKYWWIKCSDISYSQLVHKIKQKLKMDEIRNEFY